MECIFCKIIAKELPAEVIYEDDEILSILDINPMNFGHTLIMPKLHCSDILIMPAYLMPKIFTLAQTIAVAIKESLNADGINLISNIGEAAGQTVFHTHIHIIPRHEEDGFKFRLNLKKYDNGELTNIANKIRNSL